jgi:hypothetical protein
MIKGNVMDTFTILFDNGEKFALVAPNRTGALMLAHELMPMKARLLALFA